MRADSGGRLSLMSPSVTALSRPVSRQRARVMPRPLSPSSSAEPRPALSSQRSATSCFSQSARFMTARNAPSRALCPKTSRPPETQRRMHSTSGSGAKKATEPVESASCELRMRPREAYQSMSGRAPMVKGARSKGSSMPPMPVSSP